MKLIIESIILFDGVCNFCDSSVQFIIKRDKTGFFKFASLQSELGQKLLKQYGVNNNLNSLVLIENDKIYLKSSAALRVCRRLTGIWKLFLIFFIIPKPIRDYFYDIFAKNRYKWFGKKKSCELPPKDIRDRFLDQ